MSSVLFINRVYPPAEGATGQLLAELAAALVKTGWRVTVVTSRGATGLARSETVAGVRVERVGGLPFTRANHWRRALSYLSLYPALLWRALRSERHDVVVTLTDPPLLLLLGPLLKCCKGPRLVHWAQDLYPELAEQLGVLSRGGVLAGLCRRLSTWALVRQDRVLAIGGCMKQRLLERGVGEATVRVVPNWTCGAKLYPIEHSANPFRREHGLEGRFVVMYSGNLGLAHPFEAILEAAQQLQSARPEILFLFVGGGPRLAQVREQVEIRQLSNVRFLPPQPLEKLAQSLSAADVHLASMRNELCGLVVPSKVYGILAAGRPCIFLGPKESEVAQTIEQYQCGRVFSSPDGAGLIDCLIEWATHPERARAAGQRAVEASRKFGVSDAVHAFQETLRDLCGNAMAGAEPRFAGENKEYPKAA